MSLAQLQKALVDTVYTSGSIFAILIGLAQTILGALTVIQFVLMVFDKGNKPNAQIASFGKSLGGWLAKAAAFQTAQSEVKPWPFEG